jgi:uncharacterized surface protein with fasciclin (FAS1) repeats
MVEDGLDDVATDASQVSAEGADRLKTASAALADGDFSIMVQALGASGLGDELEDRDVTILVPSDDAFADLGTDGAVDLLADPSSIDDILRRHVLVEAYTLAELAEQTSVETMAGDELTVTDEGGVLEVGGARVTEIDGADERTGSGRELQVFAIDRLLLEN